MTNSSLEQVAPLSRRVVAYMIDALIVSAIAVVAGIIGFVVAAITANTENFFVVFPIVGAVTGVMGFAWFLIYSAMQGGKGSVGMRAQRITLVRAADGAALGFGHALLRNIVFAFAASFIVGYFSPLFDGTGRFQGWHDKAAGSLMLNARGVGGQMTTAPATAAAPHTAVVPLPQFATVPVQMAAAPPAAPPATAPTPASGTPAAAVPAPVSAPVAPIPTPEQESVIAFVPGITQPAPAPSSQPAPPAPLEPAHEPEPFEPAPKPFEPEPALSRASVEPAVAPVPVPALVEPEELFEEDIEDTRISIPGHRLVFTWDDGTRVAVSRRTIFGRNPSPEDGAENVAVRDETLSLSKTHFEAATEISGGWVLDRYSTNGMTLVRAGQRIACPPGQRVPIRLGDVIEIGERVVMIGGYE